MTTETDFSRPALDGGKDRKRREADRSTVMPYELEELEAAADAIASLGAA